MWVTTINGIKSLGKRLTMVNLYYNMVCDIWLKGTKGMVSGLWPFVFYCLRFTANRLPGKLES